MEHQLILYLCPELQIAQVKLQAQKELGRSYAGLLAYIEGMYTLGYLKVDEYENLKKRYSRSLREKEAIPVTINDLNAKKDSNEWNEKFRMVLDQWKEHPKKEWRDNWIAKADLWKDKVPNARRVLELAADECSSR